jgi:helicase
MTELLYEDEVGVAERDRSSPLSAIETSSELLAALATYYGSDVFLSPPQVSALESGVLDQEKHFLISAPTNSGKTLIALLRIFHRALARGGRFVYVVPLKALAEEKVAELNALSEALVRQGGRRIAIEISTGDYELNEEFPDSPPPESGEILVCTPERLEVILRSSENHPWAGAVDTYVLDEFHLLGESSRGARFESLVTELLIYCPHSSICALSATVGEPNLLKEWLSSQGKEAALVESTYRFPTLRRQIQRVVDKDAAVLQRVSDVLAESERSLIVFVYRKSDATRLATVLRESLDGSEAIAAFHAGLCASERRLIAHRFRERTLRVLVATTSLKMGINTPATDVIVRDSVFPGVGRLATSDMLQMLGRAGRGSTSGIGTILVGPKESFEMYRDDLRGGVIEPLRPRLLQSKARFSRSQKSGAMDAVLPIRTALLTQLCVRGEARIPTLIEFLQSTLSGRLYGVGSNDVADAIRFLEQEKLAYRHENSEDTYSATRLGSTASATGLCAESGAMLGGFLRALVRLEQKENEAGREDGGVLRHISSIDLLMLACASFEARDRVLDKPRAKEVSEVIEHIERLQPEEKPLLNRWRHPASEENPTRRLLSSLRLSAQGTGESDVSKVFYRYLRTALMLSEHATGLTINELHEKYGVHPGEFESGLKSTIVWVLHSLAQICTGRRCYKLDFLALRMYELIGELSLGATLGKLVAMPGFGRRSAERLLDYGIQDLHDPRLNSMEFLLGAGLKKGQAELVRRAVGRRSR